eukprot:Partr_v1_DN26718_c0_g1_i4_m8544 putative anthranilate synthase component
MLINPSVDGLADILRDTDANRVAMWTEISSDLLTPVSAYLRLSRGHSLSFLLESAGGGGSSVGRYSFLGAGPSEVLSSVRCGGGGDPLVALEKHFKAIKHHVPVELPQLEGIGSGGGAVGYLSFECVKYFESRCCFDGQVDPVGVPEWMLGVYDTVVCFDHLFRVVHVVSNFCLGDTDTDIRVEYDRVSEIIRGVVDCLNGPLPSVPVSPSSVKEHVDMDTQHNMSQEEYMQIVTRLKENIRNGDIIQAVPSQRFSHAMGDNCSAFDVYRELRALNPSPYMFFLNMGDFQIAGASPEMMCKVDSSGRVFTHPIAGTRRRGSTPLQDDALALELLADEKERAEHVMLVDLGRNDVNRVCQPRSVKVDSFMKVEKYRNVMHIVSQVSGTLRPECSPFDAFRSIFPAGTVSGAPKVRAVELIAENEREKRGVYAGAVGYFGYRGEIDTAIAIRTITFKNKRAYFQAGAGIVYDSVPQLEYEETVNKLRSNVQALA